MAFDPKIKAWVRRYYVFDRLTLEQAAEKAGVSFGTARRWKREAEDLGDDWDKARDVQVLAGGEIEDISKGLLTGFLIQYKSLMTEIEGNQELTSGEKVQLLGNLADSFAKMTSSSRKLIPTANEAAVALKTLEMVVEHIQEVRADLLPMFLEVLNGFEVKLEKAFAKL